MTTTDYNKTSSSGDWTGGRCRGKHYSQVTLSHFHPRQLGWGCCIAACLVWTTAVVKGIWVWNVSRFGMLHPGRVAGLLVTNTEHSDSAGLQELVVSS